MIECCGKLARTSQPSAQIYTNNYKYDKGLQTYSSYLPAASSLFPSFTALPAITSNFLAVSSAHRWMPNVQHNVRDWANRLIKGFAFKTSGTATLIYSCLPNLWWLDSGLQLIWLIWVCCALAGIFDDQQPGAKLRSTLMSTIQVSPYVGTWGRDIWVKA